MREMFFSQINVDRPTYSTDAAFGQTVSRTTIFTNVWCNFQPKANQPKVLFAQEKIPTTYTVFVDQDLGLKDGDIIVHNGIDHKFNGYLDLIDLGEVWSFDVVRLEK